jgi:hypothetical protein
VEKTGVPGENHWPATSHWQTLSHLNNFHEYLIQHSFKSGDTSTKDHFRWVKVLGTTPYWKARLPCVPQVTDKLYHIM